MTATQEQHRKFAPTGKHCRDGWHAWLAFITASLFFLYEFVTRIEPSLAASDISAYFGLSNTAYSTLSSMFFWVYAPMQLIVGLALDRFGARKTAVPPFLFVPLAYAVSIYGQPDHRCDWASTDRYLLCATSAKSGRCRFRTGKQRWTNRFTIMFDERMPQH